MNLHYRFRPLLLSIFASSAWADNSTSAVLKRESCEVARAFQLAIRSLPDEVDFKADPIEIVLLVRVAKDGRASGSDVTTSNVGRPVVRIMQREIRNCSFTPATNDGKPVPGTAEVALRISTGGFPAANVARCPFPDAPSGVHLPATVIFSRVRVFVDADANPTRTETLQSSAVPALDQAARVAMMKCKPLPANERAAIPEGFFDVIYEWR